MATQPNTGAVDLTAEEITAYESELAAKSTPSLYWRYVGAMLYFMGAALIAGGVVHYPIDPPQYTVICVVGAFVFLLGTIFNELVLADRRPDLAKVASLVTFSLLLSFGVGMVGGGIQHFTQFPERSAWLTPIGLVMSYIAFVAKDTDGRWRHAFSLFGGGVVVVAGLTWLGMSALASTIEPTDHGHGDAPAQTPADEDTTQDAPSDAPPEPADDGHSSHSH